jgi:protein-S-isoprenylcysteine O-methyltransferase Ste14
MTDATPAPFAVEPSDNFMRRLGQWWFRHRSWIPVPIAIALVSIHFFEYENDPVTLSIGPPLVLAGQLLRMWAVRHIGVVSRTRSTRLGPLVTSGPFAFVRNPLYIGNLLIWTGFVVWSELLWFLPIIWSIFVIQHVAMVDWEESLLRSNFGPAFDTYRETVPRWIPHWPGWAEARRVPAGGVHPLRHVLFSERGTIISVTVMSILLIAKELLS